MQSAITAKTRLKIYAGFTHLAGSATKKGRIRPPLITSRQSSVSCTALARPKAAACATGMGMGIGQEIRVKQQ
jgi:hypothetical protein